MVFNIKINQTNIGTKYTSVTHRANCSFIISLRLPALISSTLQNILITIYCIVDVEGNNFLKVEFSFFIFDNT